MRIAVIDTETTGLGATDQIVELAIVSWQHAELSTDDRWSALVRPTCPVSLEARAVHHISDEQLAESPTFEELLERRGLPELGLLGKGHVHDKYTQEPVVAVAHNMAFDERMLRQSGLALLCPKICSYRCALKLYPDAPSHSNQVLRYYLEVDVPLIRSLPPHRALPDAVVTAAVVQKMLENHTPEELIEMSSGPALLKKVSFGKHRDEQWRNVPTDYLEFVLRPEKDFNADVKYTAQYWLSQRRRPLLQPQTRA